jgi:hypothetical protein
MSEMKIAKKISMKQAAEANKDFMAAYAKAGLPDSRTIIFKGKKKKSTSHGNLGPGRQYSKFLRHVGLVYKSIS